uniref:Uncharacterized protein n=1 Tax=Cucumis melo TaxID=3656 RepID=A0A9I9EAW5_CUCME
MIGERRHKKGACRSGWRSRARALLTHVTPHPRGCLRVGCSCAPLLHPDHCNLPYFHIILFFPVVVCDTSDGVAIIIFVVENEED